MHWDILAIDPSRRSTNLLVEVRDVPGAPSRSSIRSLQARIADRSILVGVLMTRGQVLVVRDRAPSDGSSAFDVDRLSTPALLDAARLGPVQSGRAFADQALAWLRAIDRDPQGALPQEALPVMIPDLVGRLVDTELELEEASDLAACS